jgi:hypothetical protein
MGFQVIGKALVLEHCLVLIEGHGCMQARFHVGFFAYGSVRLRNSESRQQQGEESSEIKAINEKELLTRKIRHRRRVGSR